MGGTKLITSLFNIMIMNRIGGLTIAQRMARSHMGTKKVRKNLAATLKLGASGAAVAAAVAAAAKAGRPRPVFAAVPPPPSRQQQSALKAALAACATQDELNLVYLRAAYDAGHPLAAPTTHGGQGGGGSGDGGGGDGGDGDGGGGDGAGGAAPAQPQPAAPVLPAHIPPLAPGTDLQTVFQACCLSLQLKHHQRVVELLGNRVVTDMMRVVMRTVMEPMNSIWGKKSLGLVSSLRQIFASFKLMFDDAGPTTSAGRAASAASTASAASAAAAAPSSAAAAESKTTDAGKEEQEEQEEQERQRRLGMRPQRLESGVGADLVAPMGVPLEVPLTDLDDAVLGLFHNIATIDHGMWMGVVWWLIEAWNCLAVDVSLDPLLAAMTLTDQATTLRTAEELVELFRALRKEDGRGGGRKGKGEGKGREANKGGDQEQGEETKQGAGGAAQATTAEAAKPKVDMLKSERMSAAVPLDSPIRHVPQSPKK